MITNPITQPSGNDRQSHHPAILTMMTVMNVMNMRANRASLYPAKMAALHRFASAAAT